MRRKHVLGIALSSLLVSMGAWGAGPASAASATVVKVNPSATGSGITSETLATNYHYTSVPTATGSRNGKLMVFIGGTGSSPSSYTEITDRASADGFGAIDLRYPDSGTIASTCGSTDACYTKYRGEKTFGQNTTYGPGVPSFDQIAISVTTANSIVNRITSLIDYLSQSDSWWGQFLIANANSPYVTAHHGAVYPDWSKIVFAGHSQGGGYPAFLATYLSVYRVVMFSAPNDNASSVSASWITNSSSVTPMSSLYGFRSYNGGIYEPFVPTNWTNFDGGVGVGGPGHNTEVHVGTDDTGSPGTSHQLVTDYPGNTNTSLARHDSTAVNGAYPVGGPAVWDYLFTSP